MSNLELLQFLKATHAEAQRAVALHGEFASLHEALGVMDEEFHEFKLEVYKKAEARDPQRVYDELVQIAAMCAKAAQLVKAKASYDTAHDFFYGGVASQMNALMKAASDPNPSTVYPR